MNSISWFTNKILDSAESSLKTLVSNIPMDSVESSLKTLVHNMNGSNTVPVEELNESQLGIDQNLIEFVANICNHPTTFKEFPTDQLTANYIQILYLSFNLLDLLIPLKLTPKQERHAVLILQHVPELSKLRYKLCPVHMKDEMFWCVYFLLVFNKTGNILLDDDTGGSNGINDTGLDPATQLSTPPPKKKANAQQDVEAYFDKLYVAQLEEYSGNDDGDDIEAEEDNYFSPHKLKFRKFTTDTTSTVPLRMEEESIS